MLLSGKVFLAGFSGLLNFFCSFEPYINRIFNVVGINSSEYGRLNDIMYTQSQIAELENQGVNTDTFLVDRPFPLAEKRAMKKHRKSIIFDPKSTKKAFNIFQKNSLNYFANLMSLKFMSKMPKKGSDNIQKMDKSA